MKLLIITQKVDKNDTVLGFFHNWIIEFSKNYESVIVICLYKGEYDLPNNVRVLSLGKDNNQSKFNYLINFYKYIWNERMNYDKIFVHMNQEYILLGGILWSYLNKDIFMWRNHHAGTSLTDIAASFCKKVFCTSRFSFTAKYSKTEIMPVGVDIEKFKPNNSIQRINKSILSLGRISPSKNIDLLVDVISKINDSKISVGIYGDALPQDESYYEELKKKAGNLISFKKGIPNAETIDIYSKYNIFVNLSSSGMYDKTIFEAMACGCLILASNENLRGNIDDDFIFEQVNGEEFKAKIEKLLAYSIEQRNKATIELRAFAESHSLKNLSEKLFISMK